jgi:hypothetical protein
MQILDTLSLREGILSPEGVCLGCSQCQILYLPTCGHPIHITLQMHWLSEPPHLWILLNANSWHAFVERVNPQPRGRVLGVLTVSNSLSPHLWAPHSYHIANALTFGTSGSKDTTECKFLTGILCEKDSSVPRTSTSSAHDVNDSTLYPWALQNDHIANCLTQGTSPSNQTA